MSGVNIEARLIRKIVEAKDFRTAIKANISARLFRTTEAKMMFNFIKKHFHNPAHYGSTPNASIMKRKFPTFAELKKRAVKESVAELCEELREGAIRHEILEANDAIADLATARPLEALSYMRSKVLELQSMTFSSRDVVMADSANEIIEEYDAIKNADSVLTGLPWPWEELNEETQGIQQEDLIILFGRPKNMKSWIATHMAVHAYLEGNCRVLVYSCEMPPKQFRKRIACEIAQVNYTRLKYGRLTPLEEKLFKGAMATLKEDELKDSRKDGHHRSIVITTDKDGGGAGGGVSHMLAKAETVKPDLIICDSFYRMRNDRTGKRSMRPQDQAAILQDLKHATQQLHVPIIGVTQRTRSKWDQGKKVKEDDEQTEDVAFTDAAGQEADFLLRVHKVKIADDGSDVLKLHIAGAREVRASGFVVHAKLSTRWHFDTWLTEEGKRASTLGYGAEGAGVTAKIRSADVDQDEGQEAKRKAQDRHPNDNSDEDDSYINFDYGDPK